MDNKGIVYAEFLASAILESHNKLGKNICDLLTSQISHDSEKLRACKKIAMEMITNSHSDIRRLLKDTLGDWQEEVILTDKDQDILAGNEIEGITLCK